MDQYAQRITRDYPVRRKAQEKENMRTYLCLLYTSDAADE